jgi:hypothetical protein
VARLRPIAEAASRLHGWIVSRRLDGEPENQIEIIRAIGLANVGIVSSIMADIARFLVIPNDEALLAVVLMA